MNAFVLKSIALILMIMDHIYYYILGTPIWFNYLGRIVAPIFFFLLVESFFHTRDRKKFTIRLFVAAFITFLFINVMLKQPMNIFASMALGVLMLNLIEFIRTDRKNIFKSIGAYIVLIGVAYASLFTEANFLGVGMILIFYFLRDNKILMSLCYILLSLVDFFFLIGTKNFIYEIFLFNYQWMMVFAIIPILLYNGKAGHRGKFSKYFFYVIYPVHLCILLFIGNTFNPIF